MGRGTHRSGGRALEGAMARSERASGSVVAVGEHGVGEPGTAMGADWPGETWHRRVPWLQ